MFARWYRQYIGTEKVHVFEYFFVEYYKDITKS